MKVEKLYPNFKRKCVTLSYDDGVIQDIKLIDILNDFNVHGTFNLNYGLSGQIKYRDGKDNSRLVLKKNISLYDSQEIATHTLYHPHLEELSFIKCFFQIKKDKIKLEKLFNKKIIGMALPFGTYDNSTIKAIKAAGIKYCRSTKSTYSFLPPKNFILWNPTIHHTDPLFHETANKFRDSKDELALFYLWGHAYEFENRNEFGIIEDFIKLMKNENDVIFLTNGEVYNYLTAMNKLEIKDKYIKNKSKVSLYLNINEKYVCLNKGDIYYL